MTISYVVATVVVVVFVEALAGAVVLPHLTTRADATTVAADTAALVAKRIGDTATGTGQLPTDVEQFNASNAKVGPDGRPAVIELLINPAGRIVASDAPASFPVGVDATSLLPSGAANELRAGSGAGAIKSFGPGSAAFTLGPNGKTVWSLAPVSVPDPTSMEAGLGIKPSVPLKTVGYVYMQMPPYSGRIVPRARASAGALVLALTLPVGVAFGLLTTRRLRRRLRELVDASQAVAAGDFSTRVVPLGQDEVGQLERNFNDMAARLGHANRRELELASQNARLAERSRISRELHDSISQDLFSLAMLSGGLQRALPADSPLQEAIATISQTVATTIHEMRALVLDLHPSALTEKGLGAALEDLCEWYHARVGLDVTVDLEPINLDAATQHAVLRVVQEAVGNAARHADGHTVTVTLRSRGDAAELVVADDGRGFDPASLTPASGVGLRLMRERVVELGGRLDVEAREGAGTRIRASFPIRVPVP
jgi:signal transduction histidine kinase